MHTMHTSQQIRILHKTNKKNMFSELLAFWKVCSFTVYVLLQVCVHCCECALGWVKCRGQIPSMGHHTWPHTTSLSFSLSILGRGSFCFNYCLNSAWHGGDQFVALLRWYGSPGCFDSGLQLICIVGSGVSHLPLDNTP